MQVIRIDLDIARESSLLCAVVYKVLQDLTVTGVPIEGFRYTFLTEQNLTDKVGLASRSQTARALRQLVAMGLVKRMRLGNGRTFWYGTEVIHG